MLVPYLFRVLQTQRLYESEIYVVKFENILYGAVQFLLKSEHYSKYPFSKSRFFINKQ